jgi:peptide deformylase
VIRTLTQMGNPVLRKRAASVTDFSETSLRGFIDDMFETSAATGGVGIAAPQVGESLRLAIVASNPSERYPHAPAIGPIILINPVIEWKSEETEKGWEGCLSIPGIRGIVPRYCKIRVRYAALGTGLDIVAEFEDFVARVVQHEMDHLDGMLFIDRVETTLDLATEQEYRRIATGDGRQESSE